ncbi:hypothetical protein EDB83DRAFT_2530311 [Lactarius deliciosus]|nr:hypothetical protein EDB83DRAFT_2530311 [Lactarius deliciosus]
MPTRRAPKAKVVNNVPLDPHKGSPAALLPLTGQVRRTHSRVPSTATKAKVVPADSCPSTGQQGRSARTRVPRTAIKPVAHDSGSEEFELPDVASDSDGPQDGPARAACCDRIIRSTDTTVRSHVPYREGDSVYAYTHHFGLDFPWHSASRLAIDLYALPPFPSLIYTLTHTPPTRYLRRSTSVAHGPPSPVFALQEARKSLIDRLRVLAPRAVFVLNSPSRRITHLSYSFQDVKDRRPSVLTAHEPPSRHRQRSRGLLRSSSDLEEGIVPLPSLPFT